MFKGVKDYYYSYLHKVDFENITNNILPISDEETGSTVEYMKARPII
jgi:hypothetical protein